MNPESSNDVKSLVGKINPKTMGQRSNRQKPAISKKVNKNKPNLHVHTRMRATSQLKQKNILQQKFDQTISYHPRTQQSKLIYQNFLGHIYQLIQDQPQQTLLSIADQILSCLKSQQQYSQQQRKNIVQNLIGQKIQSQKFLDICNIVKNIKDYDLGEDNYNNDEVIVMENYDENQVDQQQRNDQYISQEQLNYQQQQVNQNQQEDNQQQDNNIMVKNQYKKQQHMQNQTQLSVNTITAHWLQNKISQFYDPSQVLKVQKQIMQILNKKTKLQVQNGLLSLLNYQKYDLIKLLLINKQKIYFLTKYHQTQNPKQKQIIKEQMRLKNIFIDKNNKNIKDNNKINQNLKNTIQIEQEQNIPIKFNSAKQQEILKIPKKKIDLSIHDSTDYRSKKQQFKFKLPDGAQKIQKPGYQQIRIPAKKNQVKTQLIQITTLPLWMQPVFTGIKRFNPIQSKVLDYTLKTNQNMLVCAPTSAGKTNIALLSILQVISNYVRQDQTIDLKSFKIVYIAPMKALVSQITGNLSNRLKCLNITVKQLTGDIHLTKTQIQQTQVIVSTPQKWDIITRKAGQRVFTQKVKLLIIDEIHLLSDSRGPVLQSIIARTIRQVQTTQQQVRIVGLSATLPNYKDVGITLRVNAKKGLFYFDQSYRPIPLEQMYIGITQKKGVRKMMMINEILYEKVMERVSNQQIIIFVHSRRDTVRTAKAIKQAAYTRDQLHKILRPDSQSKKILQAIAQQQTINSKDLKQLLLQGIGIHHAGLSRPDRDLVQQLFADRHLNILVSTATLAWGVNLPAHTVIIKGTQVYSPEQGRWVEVSLQDIMQMLGRAGRPHFDTEGEGMIITGYQEIRYYLSLLNLQIPLESQMLKSLPDQLNAQIVLGTINNIKDAVNWLSYTYLYIRMLKNPKYYSISSQQMQQDSQLLKRRVNLVHSAACILQNNGLINYDRKNGVFSSTFLGKIASHYYIKHSSMTVYNSNLKNNSGLIQLFKIFAMSSQFKYLAVRQQEKNQLKKLVETVPVPIKGSLEQPQTKICALLQAYISRLPLQGYALNVDKVYVTQSASRIMRGLFQICLKRGWGQAAIKTLQLSKMIDKSMWSCLNPLRQFKQIPEYVLSRLQKKQQFSWQSFYHLSAQQIGDLTKFPKLGKILHKFIHHIPRVQIQAYAQPLTRSSLKIELKIKGDFKWEDQHHGKQQGFWIFVLDCNEQNILFSYYFVLKKDEMNFSTQFIVPLFEILHPLYYIKVISDRWITTTNSLPLSFKNIILPQKFSPPTQLLDLQPLPLNQLPSIAKSFKISFLNQIQTQTFNSIYHSNQNVFLGSSQSCGKFSLSLLAADKTLSQNKKVIIICPFQQLMKSRYHQVIKLLGQQYKISHTFNQLNKDTQILANNNIIISTPSAWEVLSRRYKARKGWIEIGLIIIDGIHLLTEDNGHILEIIISRMRSIIETNQQQKKIRIIATSASIADYKQLSEWIGASSQHTYNFHPSVRPNNFQLIFSSHDQIIRQSRTYMMQKNLYQMIKHYNRNNIIFTNSKKQTKLTSIDFITLLQSEPNPKRFLKINQDQFKSLEKKINDKFLIHTLSYGIGYLYKGMNQVEKQIVLKLFQIQGINILVIEETLKWELENIKAFVVAVLDAQKYSCKKKRWIDYSICQMIRFMGMSKLQQKDKQKGKQYSSSKFIILCQSSKKNFYKKFLFQPYPLQSSLHNHLPDALNSAIVPKLIQTKQQCIDWLSWTFFYRRIIQNPNYYNLQQVSQQGISSYLSELIETSVEYLQSIKCVQEEENQEESILSATNLGIICSYYGIKVGTLAVFVERLNENIKLKGIIQLLCQSQQLSHISYRPGQFSIISQLLLSTSHPRSLSKPQSLLYLYLSRICLPQQLSVQLLSILPILTTLIHSLIDTISCLGYLKPIILSMQLCQLIIQGMQIDDNGLIQIMDKKTAKMFQEKYQIKSINQFMNMDDQVREKQLKGKNIQKIAQACNRYPIVNLDVNLLNYNATQNKQQQQIQQEQQQEQEQEQQIHVKIKLSRDQPLQSLNIISQSYLQQKQQIWWVIIGQKKTNKVLTTKRMLFKSQNQILLEFQKIKKIQKYVVYALCDSYVGCDQAKEIIIGSKKNYQQKQ